ncbi:MAG: outer membrane lipoprotein carrier protein LolA [Bacteroidales bacterium]|nr:outer membrane lipoprotein carrier protein LolA [Bacteroidales bacterium]
MNKTVYIGIVTLLFAGQIAFGQSIPLSANEKEAFNKLLTQVATGTESLSAAFSQEKSIPMLKSKMVSKGLFLYKKEDKIAFLYREPADYQMIINGNKLRVVSEGSDHTMNLKNNPVMEEVRGLISASFLGRLSQKSNSYSVELFSMPNSVIVKVTPLNRQLLAIIKEITITFDSKSAQIERLLIEEGSGGYTEYIFSNQKRNIVLKDEDFRVN